MLRMLIRTNDDWVVALLRVTLGVVIFAHGGRSLLGWFGGSGLPGTINGFGEIGMPAAVAVLVASTEFFGGLGLVVGFLTRLCATGTVAIMAGAVALVHWQFGFFMNWFGQQAGEGFEYHLLVMAMAVALVARGGGAASVDRFLTTREAESREEERLSGARPKSVGAGIAGLAMALLVASAPADAQVALPPVNLTPNFLDGVAGPGVLAEQTFEWRRAGTFRDSEGRAVPGDNRVSSLVGVTHVAWLSRFRVLGAYYGAEALLPVAAVRVRADGEPPARGRGIGDLTVSPVILQWSGGTLLGRRFSHRFALPITLPTGDNDPSESVNIGAGHWSIDPYWAFTLEPTSAWEVSGRLMHLWNGTHHGPREDGTGSVRPGSAFHANLATSYEVARGKRLGLAGYLLLQTSPHEVDRRMVPDAEERVYALGPGIAWSRGRTLLKVNGFAEAGAWNRSMGPKLVVRLAHVIP